MGLFDSVGETVGAIANPIGSITTGTGLKFLGDVTKTPGAPGLTAQELDANRAQVELLNQQRDILNQDLETIKQNRGLLQNLSGLFDADGNVDPAAVEKLKGEIDTDVQNRQRLSDLAQGRLEGSFDQGSAVPQLFQDQFQTFNPNLTGIQNQVNALDGGVAQAERARLEAALSGELQPSNAIIQDEQKSFEQLKEAAGQRGIKLEGDDLFTATSQSTAGNQLLADLRRNAETRRDSERRGIINQATQSNLSRQQLAGNLGINLGNLGLGGSRLGLEQRLGEAGNLLAQGGLNLSERGQEFDQAQSLQSQPFQTQLGFGLQSLSPTGVDTTNLANSFAGSAQPFTDQRLLNYQGDLQSQANRLGLINSIIGLGGTLGGAALSRPAAAAPKGAGGAPIG